MKAWIFDVGEGLTGNWHSGGGLMVVAASGEDAAEMVASEVYNLGDASETGLDFDAPEAMYEIAGDPEPRVWIFPDAGCC